MPGVRQGPFSLAAKRNAYARTTLCDAAASTGKWCHERPSLPRFRSFNGLSSTHRIARRAAALFQRKTFQSPRPQGLGGRVFSPWNIVSGCSPSAFKARVPALSQVRNLLDGVVMAFDDDVNVLRKNSAGPDFDSAGGHEIAETTADRAVLGCRRSEPADTSEPAWPPIWPGDHAAVRQPTSDGSLLWLLQTATAPRPQPHPTTIGAESFGSATIRRC